MTDEKEMRQVLANTLAEIANTDKRIVVLEADLMGEFMLKVSPAYE